MRESETAMVTMAVIITLRSAAAAMLLRAHLDSALRMVSRSASRSARVFVVSQSAGALRGEKRIKTERNHNGGKTTQLNNTSQYPVRKMETQWKKDALKSNLKKYCARVMGSGSAETD